jgi:hypothetical protein
MDSLIRCSSDAELPLVYVCKLIHVSDVSLGIEVIIGLHYY